MSGRIKRISQIKQMAVFQDFCWDSSVRDKGNNIADFKKINIFYGRNYSGKTTLSRLFRALETGSFSSRYGTPEFHIAIDGGAPISQHSLDSHGHTIRVFNKDFITENLRFMVDDEHEISSFAILGEENTRLEEQIELLESELGSEESKIGLYYDLSNANTEQQKCKQAYDNAKTSLDGKLRDKANNAETGIKHNPTFKVANYNVVKIKADIDAVTKSDYVPISQSQVDEYGSLLKEEPKDSIPQFPSLDLTFEQHVARTKELVEKKITASNPIQELLSNASLQAWVKKGREHHESKRMSCAFCGGDIPKDLWEKLDKHFNQESENLQKEIDTLLQAIEKERGRTLSICDVDTGVFYTNFQEELEKLSKKASVGYTQFIASLDELTRQLKDRKSDIFSTKEFNEPDSVVQVLNDIRDEYEQVRSRSNEMTESLSKRQSEARTLLRLHEVHTFISDIKYSDECETINNLKMELESATENKRAIQQDVNHKMRDIAALKIELKDESKGADKVNEYLNSFFGHQHLSLKAIPNSDENVAASGYRFEITRNDRKAFHLSDGECSLIAFCYFVAKLEDIETKDSQPIIWIDDPISSLDANHVFFIFSLINAEIVAPEKFKQLFISTHSLDFLKYIKRLPQANSSRHAEYFIVNRGDQQSCIMLMPRYLKNYVTEFNYLFHQIYKCAKADIGGDDHNCYYNFGNNARKFLESFLYYKYPDATSNDEKMVRFFGDDALATSLTNRVTNEYSHLNGVFERGMRPVDAPEMKTTAEFILKKLKEHDLDQYNALLVSIGESQSTITSTA